jgi:hypothetical protein
MKYALVLCSLLAVWLILSLTDLRRAEKNTTRSRVPNYSLAEMSDIFALEQQLEDESKKMQLYRKNQGAILARLSTERLTLRKAATMLNSQARDNYPLLHDMLGDRYPALSSEERMALLLLEHLEGDGCRPEVIERLCGEMTTWSKADPTLFRQPRDLQLR